MSNAEREARAKIDLRAHALLAAATLACLLVYLGRPHAGFVFDDSVTILHNRLVQQSPLGAVRENPFRSVVNLTFWLQHRLCRPAFTSQPLSEVRANIRPASGERLRPEYVDPATGAAAPVTVDTARGIVYPLPPAWPFHLFNLALHLLNGWLLFCILRRLGAPFSNDGDGLAAACAGAFLLHPLATEPVNYITARFALMALAFSLAATLAHLRADDRPRGELIAAGLYVLALFCKETAAPLPVMLFVLDAARGQSRPVALLGLVPLIVYAAARSRWMVVLGARPGDVLDWPLYLLAQQRVFWLYLTKAALPIRLNFDYHLLSRPALDGAFALLNLALVGVSSGLLLRALTRARAEAIASRPSSGKKSPPGVPTPAGPAEVAAGVVLLCWLALAPTSSFIPLADLAREDRAYPLLAILIPAAGFGLARLIGPARLRPAVLAALTAVFLLAAGTFARNAAWETELTLHRDIVRQSPAKPRAAYNYATALKWHGRLAEALRWYERTLALDPSHENARVNRDALLRLSPPAD